MTAWTSISGHSFDLKRYMQSSNLNKKGLVAVTLAVIRVDDLQTLNVFQERKQLVFCVINEFSLSSIAT